MARIVGQPTDYAIIDNQIRLFPAPNADYTIVITGVTGLPALDYTNPESENGWTTQAYDLIAARARYLLHRDYFRDNEAASVASIAEGEALRRLRGEATRMLGTGRVKAKW